MFAFIVLQYFPDEIFELGVVKIIVIRMFVWRESLSKSLQNLPGSH